MVSIIPKNYPHTTNSEEGQKSYWEYLFIDPETILREKYPENKHYQEKLLHIINRKAYFGHAHECTQLAGIVLTIMEEMRYRKEFYVDAVKALTTALLFEIARLNSDKADDVYFSKRAGIAQLSKALDYISTAYSDTIKIEVLADMCNMSETHFRRLFVEYMNMTPVEYINLVRVQMACENMKKTSDPMNVIAIKSGFATTTTFNRNFKRIVGVTPYRWKRNPDNYEGRLLQFHISAEKGW
jgi:AraC-like DNA-binding protein